MIYLHDLLKFENSSDILKFRFSYDRMLMWPFIRYEIFQKTLQDHMNHQDAHASHSVSLKAKIAQLLFTISRSPFRKKQANANFLFFSVCAPNNTFLLDGKYFNRLVDYHYDICDSDSAAVLESYYGGVIKKPRKTANLYAKDFIALMALLKSSMTNPDASDKKQSEDLLAYIANTYKFGISNIVVTKLKQRLTRTANRLPYYHHYYKKLFKTYKPRLIFQHGACYGHESFISKWAHDANIKVAELQHGAVYKNHPAYNYGSALSKNDEYRTYLPDYYLTYGAMWNDRISLPCKVISVGNPHFLNQKRQLDKSKSDSIILIASQGTISNDLVNIAIELSKLIPENYRIIYKFHHGEVAFKERFTSLKKKKNIQLSSNDDIYHLINKSKFIVSCYSTTLFEAAALQKKVFIYDHPLSRTNIPKGLGQWFQSAQELYKLLFANNNNQNIISSNEIMDPAFEQNFAKFLDQHL